MLSILFCSCLLPGFWGEVDVILISASLYRQVPRPRPHGFFQDFFLYLWFSGVWIVYAYAVFWFFFFLLSCVCVCVCFIYPVCCSLNFLDLWFGVWHYFEEFSVTITSNSAFFSLSLYSPSSILITHMLHLCSCP